MQLIILHANKKITTKKNGSSRSWQIFHMQMIYRDVFVKSKHERERKLRRK